MKIKATVVYANHERVFVIPCGTGNKTIKWLGMVASQRYSNAAPNGALRRRDDYCGITENAQYQVENVYLPNGKIAHPGIMIYDSDLKDGDEVTVRLGSRLNVHGATGSPTKTKWSMLAFSTTSMEDPNLNSARTELYGHEDESVEAETLVGEENKAAYAQIQAKAKFMRIILRSQMIDEKKLAAKLDKIWPRIASGIPRLRPEDVQPLKKVLQNNWDMLSDIFEYHVDGLYMTKDNFFNMIEEAEIFPSYNASQQCAKIYARTCAYTGIDDEHFDFTCLIISLFLAAQVKYNDTLEAGAESLPSYEALDEVFHFHFVPIAETHSFQSILKYAFCSDECLAYLRPLNDELQVIFNRYSTRHQDLPISITIDDLNEILFHANLINDINNDINKTKNILIQIHKSTIIGLENEMLTSKPENEVSFAEFVEAIARAGFIKYFDPEGEPLDGDASETGNSIDGNSVISSSIIGCLVLGVRAVVEKNNSTTAEKQPNTAKGKYRKK